MNDYEKIQAVINTLESLQIPATFENVSRLTGVFRTLAEVRDNLQPGKEEPKDV